MNTKKHISLCVACMIVAYLFSGTVVLQDGKNTMQLSTVEKNFHEISGWVVSTIDGMSIAIESIIYDIEDKDSLEAAPDNYIPVLLNIEERIGIFR